MIPYGIRYTASAQGCMPKIVSCENCSQSYVYVVTMEVGRAATSMLFIDMEGAQEKAKESARRALMAELEQAVLAVPCPFCGQYQQNMVPIVRRLRYQWLGRLSLGVLVLGVLSLIFSCGVVMTLVPDGRPHGLPLGLILWWTLAVVCFLGSSIVLVGRSILSRRFDPNSEDNVEDRKELGRSHAISLDDFLKMASEEPNPELGDSSSSK